MKAEVKVRTEMPVKILEVKRRVVVVEVGGVTQRLRAGDVLLVRTEADLTTTANGHHPLPGEV